MDGYTRDKLFNYKVREDPRVPKEPSEIDQLVIETWTVSTIGMIRSGNAEGPMIVGAITQQKRECTKDLYTCIYVYIFIYTYSIILCDLLYIPNYQLHQVESKRVQYSRLFFCRGPL